MKKLSQGGAREGAGRKLLYGEETKCMRVPVSRVAAVRAFLYSLLDEERKAKR